MRSLSLAVVICCSAACSSGGPPIIAPTTSGATSSAGSTTGAGSTTSGATSTSTSTSTGSTTGATSAATAAASTSGTGTGTTTASASTTGSTTGPGYQPYDAGSTPTPTPSPDGGCVIWDAVLTDAGTCVQCLGDSDCPSPLICDTSLNICVACDAAHPACPAGTICMLPDAYLIHDTCIPDCRLDAGVCAGQVPGACDFDSGYCANCYIDADCPPATPYCVGDPAVFGPSVCAQCQGGGALGPGDGCPAGELCQGLLPEGAEGTAGICEFDCRLDAGACRPGICDLTGLSNDQYACWTNACASDADCRPGPNPYCYVADSGIDGAQGIGGCVECLDSSDCQALGIGIPLCDTFYHWCTSVCEDADGGPLSCSGQPCLFFDGGTYPGWSDTDQCGCLSDSDCAGQPATPTCIPTTDAGLNAAAGDYGACGCTVGAGCPQGSVCETRGEILGLSIGRQQPLFGACIPDCMAGGASGTDCSRVAGTVDIHQCNAATGYCTQCVDNNQCSEPTPVCVPLGDVPGDGYCGCSSPADCDDGLTCQYVGIPYNASCVPPCERTDTGYDSCLYNNGFSLGRCNTESGLCQQCLTGSDCAGLTLREALSGSAQDICTDGGQCVACITAADCPQSAPGCSYGVCGECGTAADCPAFAPACVGATILSGKINLCVPACTPDGGQCDPSSQTPVCNATLGYCVQCGVDSDCSSDLSGLICTAGFCVYKPL